MFNCCIKVIKCYHRTLACSLVKMYSIIPFDEFFMLRKDEKRESDLVLIFNYVSALGSIEGNNSCS